MYSDLSTNVSYPKTLVIRNHTGGMIWQIYQVEKEVVAERLANNATKNGFQAITLENHQPDMEETYPNWKADAPHIIAD